MSTPDDLSQSRYSPVADSGHLLPNLILFGRLLRDIGLNVPAGAMLEAVIALDHIDIGHQQDFYHTLQTLLIHRTQDLSPFDEAFRMFWRIPRNTRSPQKGLAPPKGPPQTQGNTPSGQISGYPADTSTEPTLQGDPTTTLSYSTRRVSRTKDFATFSDAEMAEARDMMASLTWTLGMRLTRRWQTGRGTAIDLRRVVRSNLKFGAELITLPRRRRRWRMRPLVLLCDVSGSMERYSRMLLHFIHTLARGFEQAETFLFSTSLTRVTRQLAKRAVDDVVPTLPRHVTEWSGGTRIGEALKRFNVDWARRIMGHAPVVLLISDGWDRGDPAKLAAEMAHLQRRCYRLIWLNPLLGSPRYRPLTRGMQAALPWIDDFLPVHNLASLEALAAHLNDLPPQRTWRRQQGLQAMPRFTATPTQLPH